MRIAFAGLRHGHIFSLYAMAEKEPDVTIAGIWEEEPAALAAARERIDAPVYPSLEALLADESVDAVAVGDYYGIRGQRVIAALRAGKHVIADKPLCTSLSELDEIERLSREKNLQVGIMLSLRYDATMRLARTLVQEGRIGAIRNVACTGQHPIDYPQRAGWYFEPGKHGGTFNDIGIHGFDAISMVTGLQYGRTLFARQWNCYAPECPHFLDSAQVMGEWANGAAFMSDVSYCAPSPSGYRLPTYWRFTFWGADGMIECRFHSGELLLARNITETPPDRSDEEAMRAFMQKAEPVVYHPEPIDDNELREFIRAVRGEETYLPPRSCLDSTRIALSIQHFADEHTV